MPTKNECHDVFSSDPQVRMAEIQRVLDLMVALGLAEVRTDGDGEQSYRLTELGRVCHFPDGLSRSQ